MSADAANVPRLASAVGARLLGDDYQHALTWLYAVRLLIEDSGVTSVGMEVDDAGNVDDLTVTFDASPTEYTQVKFARRAGEPIAHTWFTDLDGATRSPLQRFYGSYQLLMSDAGPAKLRLVTNRVHAAGDPVLAHREGFDGRLVPRWTMMGANSESGKLRVAWAKHLGIGDAELIEFLEHFHIQLGADATVDLEERCGDVMRAAGLSGDSVAVTTGVARVRRLIAEGCREINRRRMREIVDELDLKIEPQTATVIVQGIAVAPYADAATATLDWVGLYDGDSPSERRRLADPLRALPQMHADIERILAAVRSSGYTRVLLAGDFRLGTAFALGAAFNPRTGFELTARQGPEIWSTAQTPVPVELEHRAIAMLSGTEIAVCLSISNDIANDVQTFIERDRLDVGQIEVITPAAGPSRTVVADAGDAAGIAQATLDIIRAATAEADRVHVFASAPRGVMLMLGHIWNRLPPTVIYEDLNPGYQRTFELPAS